MRAQIRRDVGGLAVRGEEVSCIDGKRVVLTGDIDGGGLDEVVGEEVARQVVHWADAANEVLCTCDDESHKLLHLTSRPARDLVWRADGRHRFPPSNASRDGQASAPRSGRRLTAPAAVAQAHGFAAVASRTATRHGRGLFLWHCNFGGRLGGHPVGARLRDADRPRAGADDRPLRQGRACVATHELSAASVDERTMSAGMRLQADKLCR